MLYAQDETNYGSFLLKLMVDRALNGYEAKDNLIYRQKIIDILKDVERLHQSEDEIYNINLPIFERFYSCIKMLRKIYTKISRRY